ncbi:MAG: Gfo/Idh/MocA family oxidoreductase [Muribaculaceae bacterium]|nr:Gfo/Idh/MocA family oxidoreductase [Muribaculaceae bacterium]
MTKVITYGTYDFLHEGHIRLLERAKALGDYLIVGVTADDFDMARGKINVRQSLMERVEAIRQTGLADKIIIEEYEGQKIDDIRRYEVDIFTVGSDWVGKFDYLNEFCKVVYLDRTEGISSTEIRSQHQSLRIGLVGETNIVNKFKNECHFVNGIEITGIYASSKGVLDRELQDLASKTEDYVDLLKKCDAVYIASKPSEHYAQVKTALESDVNVLCESPITMTVDQFKELSDLAYERKLVLMDGIKTAYSLAFNRMMLLIKSGIIGEILSVDTTCTSLIDIDEDNPPKHLWNSITAWGPTALLPIFKIFGTDYVQTMRFSKPLKGDDDFDLFTKISFIYDAGVASIKVGQGVKSEGEMVISGTKGYVYVPAPWWKTDYFEVRYENPSENKRYFYQLEGEGIRYEILSFLNMIKGRKSYNRVSPEISRQIIEIVGNKRELQNGSIF